MSDWQTDLFEAIEGFAGQVEEWVVDRSQDLVESVEAFVLFSEEVVTQVQTTLDTELEPFLEELEPFLNDLLNPLFGFSPDDFPAADTADRASIPTPHALCQTCQHYHGQVYGGNLLVCGMHPYGLADEDTHCPDREESETDDRSNPFTNGSDWWT